MHLKGGIKRRTARWLLREQATVEAPFPCPLFPLILSLHTRTQHALALSFVSGVLQAYVVLCLKPAIQYAVFNRLKAVTLAYGRRNSRGLSERPEELTAVQVRP